MMLILKIHEIYIIKVFLFESSNFVKILESNGNRSLVALKISKSILVTSLNEQNFFFPLISLNGISIPNSKIPGWRIVEMMIAH